MDYFHQGPGGTVISGTQENDKISNWTTSSVTINGGAGADSINNGGSYSKLNGDDGNDYIRNWGNNSTLRGGKGDDTLSNDQFDSFVRMFGDDGNDTISNRSPNTIIDGGAGNDSIENTSQGSLVAINGGDDDDYILNGVSSITIDGGAGNDSIFNTSSYSWNVSINGGADDDYISVSSSKMTVNGGSGNDIINSPSWSAVIDGGKGDDSIRVLENYATIRYADGDGDDTIHGFTEKMSSYYDYPNVLQITAGSVSSVSSIGSDAILKIGDGSVRLINSANRTIKLVDAEGNAFDTVIGNAISVDGSLANNANDVMIRLDGNDIVTLKGARQIIDVGEGNNTIVGYDEDDTVRVDFWKSSYYRPRTADGIVSVSGSDVIVGDDEHTLVIKGAAKKKIKIIDTEEKTLYVPPVGSTVAADSLINYVINLNSNVRLDVGTQIATIDNHSDKVTVKADGGTADITSAGSNVSIKTGGGDDSIGISGENENGISNVTIDAGDGNNCIGISAGTEVNSSILNGENFNVKTGAGIDIISICNVDKARVNTGDGNDSIDIAGSGRSTIDAGDGDNNIEIALYGYEATDLNVRSGAGVDSILGHGLRGTSVDAGAGNDTIRVIEKSRRFTLNGGAGDDTIVFDDRSYDGRADALILGGDGHDSIHNDGGNYLTLDGGAGNDTIYNDDGKNVTILGGAGDDSIYSYGQYNVIVGGDGNDTVYSDDEYISINGGKGNDSITAVEGAIYQYANGDGDDTIGDAYSDWILNLTSGSVSGITTEGDGFKIKIGTGSILVSDFEEYNYRYKLPLVVMDSKNNFSAWQRNANGTFSQLAAGASGQIGDFFYNLGSKTTLNIDDLDLIRNYGSNVKINATVPSAESFISNYGSNVTIDTAGEDGDKYFDVHNKIGSNVLINTKGIVYNDGAGATINCNSVNNSGDKVLINAVTVGGENYGAFVENTGSNVTINAFDSGRVDDEDDSYTQISNRGDKVLINATLANSNDDGYSNIDNDGADVTIRSSSLDNYIGNSARNVKIDSDAGDDSIYNSGASVSINAGEGNDSIRSTSSGENVTIIAGAGNDTIRNYSDFATIEAGDGDDFIRDSSFETTVNAGAGNDILSLDGGVIIQYKVGDGNDTVYGEYYEGDTLQFSGAYSTVLGKEVREDFDGNEAYDVVVKVDGGSITFVAASNQTLNIAGGTLTGGGSSDTTPGGGDDTVPSGITFNPKKPTSITITDYTGTIDANDYSDKVTTIDASKSKNDGLVIKANDKKGTVINAGAGASTLLGGAKDDKLNGGDGVNVFAYTVDKSKDAVFKYQAQDVVSIGGATFDKMSFVDSKGSVKIKFNGDAKSQLTVNKNDSDRAITFDIGGETFTYGELPTGVEFDNKDKKTALNVSSLAADGVVVDAGSIVSTAKTIDGSAASGAVYLIGNANANVIKAGAHGSTLFGGRSTKAVADKLYGGAGEDVFMWSTLDGADVIYSLDGGQGDKVVLEGVTELKNDAIKWSGNKVVVTVGKQKLTLDDPRGEICFVDSNGTLLNKTGVNFSSGVGYNAKKTAVVIGSDAVDVEPIDLSDPRYLSTVKEINATAYGGAIELSGNANANVIYAGSGGSTLYGGKGDAKKPSADKLYGGEGKDVFVYAAGDGNDVIYGFDGGKDDKVVLEGVTELKDADVKVSANKVEVTINKQKLTLDNPTGKINFVDSDNTVLYTTGVNFPSGVGYDKKKTAITLGSDAADVDPIDLSDSKKYLSTVKEINATAYGGAIDLTGNANANVLRAGSGGGTLDGGYDATRRKVTADKLYGSSATTAADVFVWDAVWGGADQIYNYSAAAGDIISVTGVDSDVTINNSDFKLSGNKVVMTVGTGKLTINDLVDSKTVVVAYGDKTFGYATLPAGVDYDAKSKNKLLTIGGAFEGTFDVTAQDYLGTVATIDASTSTNEIELIGNQKTKAMVGGKGKTTMRGSTANDNFYAGDGADVIVYSSGGGKDVVYKFNSETDVIRLSDTTVETTNFVEKGKDIVLTVGKGTITLKDAPRGAITVEQGDETLTYKTLPTGVTYKYTKNIGTVTIGKDFSGTLAADDLGLPVSEINTAAVKTLKLELAGDLTAGKVSGKNVELTTAGGTVTLKSAVDKDLTVINDGVEEKYKFTKTNNTLEKALIGGSSSEIAVAAEDYWFMQSDDVIDELTEIAAPIDPCVLDEPKVFLRPSLDISRMLTFNRKK